MKKLCKVACASAALIAVSAGGQAGAEGKHFAMVFQVLNNAFTPPLQQGCEDAA